MRLALLVAFLIGCGGAQTGSSSSAQQSQPAVEASEAAEDAAPSEPDQVETDEATVETRSQRIETQRVETQRVETEEVDPAEQERLDRQRSAYFGLLMSRLRQGWALPSTIDRQIARELWAEIEIEVSGVDLRIVFVRVRRSSGNTDFDHSIVRHLQRLARSDSHVVPPPPDSLQDEVIGRPIILHLLGRSAHD